MYIFIYMFTYMLVLLIAGQLRAPLVYRAGFDGRELHGVAAGQTPNHTTLVPDPLVALNRARSPSSV